MTKKDYPIDRITHVNGVDCHKAYSNIELTYFKSMLKHCGVDVNDDEREYNLLQSCEHEYYVFDMVDDGTRVTIVNDNKYTFSIVDVMLIRNKRDLRLLCRSIEKRVL